MKKVVFNIWLMALAIGQLKAGNGKELKKFTPAQLNQTTRLVRNMESPSGAKSKKAGEYGTKLKQILAKKGPVTPGKVQDMVSVSTLGESINPFTSIGNGRTNLFANPATNTIGFFRRGGPNDPAGPDGAPGNRLYYDINTRGGADGYWQISKGPVYKNDPFDVTTNNYGTRYPQGVIWTPQGSADTNQAIAVGVTPVLDGTNGAWGALGRGWQGLGSPQPAPKQTVAPSGDVFHYISEGMDVTSTGKIFFVDPERDETTGSVVYNNQIIVYGMSYNTATNDWDSTVTFIPFNATRIATSTVAFGPDGTTGYIVVLAESPDFNVINVYAPFVSKTTDGGLTWSSFHLVDINPESLPSADSLRDIMLGSWVNFRSDGAIVPVDAGSPYSHKVQYSTAFDMDATVDQYNYVHIFTVMAVGGFTDTLEASDPPTIRSGLGLWAADFYMNDPASPFGFIMNGVNSLRGCWGDCAGTENFTEDNRPQTTRNQTGSMLGFCYFDTDTAEFEPVEDNPNSNPDFWVRGLLVSGPGQFMLSANAANKTKGSNVGGQVVCGNVSPYMLPSGSVSNGFTIPTSAILLSTFDMTTSPWPVTHLYLEGITMRMAIDTFPVNVEVGHLSFRLFTDAKGIIERNRFLNLSLTPNPAKNALMATLSAPYAGNVEIVITNSLGQVVEKNNVLMSKANEQIPVNIASLRNGIYFLTARFGDQRISKRFVKE